MIFRRIVFIALAVAGGAAFVAGCKSATSVIDDNSYGYLVPHISQFSVAPTSINTDTLPPSSKSLYDSVSINLAAQLTIAANTPPDSVASASVNVYDAEGYLLTTYSFLPANQPANDSILTGTITFKILRLKAGPYQFRALISTAEGNTDGATALVNVSDSAYHPPVLSNIIAPDSMTVPSIDTLTAQATDPAGQGALDSVNAAVFDATHKFIKIIPFAPVGGNQYQGTVVIDSTYRRASWYLFYVYAVDNANISSDTVVTVVYTR